MRALILKMSMSMDGFVGAGDGGLEWMFAGRSPEGMAWTVAKISDATSALGACGAGIMDEPGLDPRRLRPTADPANESRRRSKAAAATRCVAMATVSRE